MRSSGSSCSLLPVLIVSIDTSFAFNGFSVCAVGFPEVKPATYRREIVLPLPPASVEPIFYEFHVVFLVFDDGNGNRGAMAPRWFNGISVHDDDCFRRLLDQFIGNDAFSDILGKRCRCNILRGSC